MATTQLIDAQGDFVGQLPVTDAGGTQAYKIIAVVGCQSGGKSTLLNHTFGTSFPVLDAPRKGRRRTTLGVWGAIAKAEGSTYVVLDVEGTDSRERGEGAKAFESRTTLFTLALANCVLVNMWAHDIGRYSAANYDLFETVFAHAIALRRAGGVMAQRTASILIVVRDHDGESAVSDIRRVLMGDLTNIWDSLRVRDIPFSNAFHVDVVTLPHKTYAPGAFADGTHHLAQRVAIETGARHNPQLVPLEAFDTLAAQVWAAVCKCTGGQRDAISNGVPAFSLDLPKQATLTAHYRCGEIASAIWDEDTGQSVDGLRTDIESHWQKPIAEFGSRIETVVREAFEAFDNATASYCANEIANQAVAQRRSEFGVKLAGHIVELRERYLSVCWDFCMNEFDDKFRPMLGGTNGYERNARRLAKSCTTKYHTLMQEADIPRALKKFMEVQTEDADGHRNINNGNGASEEEEEYTVVEEVDVVDLHFGLEDEEDDLDADEWSVERFRRDVMQKVEERKRLGELMLPGGAGNFGPGGPKKEPWWKGLLIRGVILLINYLQATHGQRAAMRLLRKHEKEFPPAPTF